MRWHCSIRLFLDLCRCDPSIEGRDETSRPGVIGVNFSMPILFCFAHPIAPCRIPIELDAALSWLRFPVIPKLLELAARIAAELGLGLGDVFGSRLPIVRQARSARSAARRC